jgi:hypothetical protein
MKAVIVYESVYGNTREIAEAVAEGLRERAEVELLPVGEVGTALERADLVVVGGPTHMHGMASRLSMRGAVDDARKKHLEAHLERGVGGPTLRDWLDRLPRGDQVAAAAFDTRLGKPAILTGSAAKGIGRRLERRGYQLVASLQPWPSGCPSRGSSTRTATRSSAACGAGRRVETSGPGGRRCSPRPAG